MPPSNPGLFQHSTKQIGKRRLDLATLMPHRTHQLQPIKLRLNISLNGKNLRRQAHFRGNVASPEKGAWFISCFMVATSPRNRKT